MASPIFPKALLYDPNGSVLDQALALAAVPSIASSRVRAIG
jgi:hypothetical protein